MTKDEVLGTDWKGNEKVWVLEVKDIEIKNPFSVNLEGTYTLLYPTGKILKSDLRLDEFDRYRYIRASLIKFDICDPRNYSFSCRYSDFTKDELCVYNYHFNKFLTYDEAESFLPIVRDNFEKRREVLYKRFQEQCETEIERFYMRLDKYTSVWNNLKNNIMNL